MQRPCAPFLAYRPIRRGLGVALAAAPLACAANPSSAPASSGQATLAPPASPPAPPAATSHGTECPVSEGAGTDAAPPFPTSGDTLGVVRIAPERTLPLKAGPYDDSATIVALPYDASNLWATGEVCANGEVRWLRVRADDAVGWVDGRFAMPTTPARDESEGYANRMGAGAAPSPESAVAPLVGTFAPDPDSEVPYLVELVGIARAGSVARAELWECCMADDSIQGKQVSLELRSTGAGWSLHSAKARYVCRRGVRGDRCL